MSDSLLTVENLTVEFPLAGRLPFRAVDDVSFDVRPGEAVGIVGESGSGKTVTMRTIGGLPTPAVRTDGEIGFAGKPLLSLSGRPLRAARTDMAAVFQNPRAALDPVFTVGSQLTETIRARRRVSGGKARAEAMLLLESVGIPDPPRRMAEFPHSMSGGMAQRVSIALALACAPRILLADEPTSALDVSVQAQIVDLMDNLRREEGMSLLFISHDIGAVAQLCERIVVMYAGRVVESGRTREVIAEPSHPYTAALISAVPRIAASRRADGLPFVEIPAGSGPRPHVTDPVCNFTDRCTMVAEECHLNPATPRHLAGDRVTRCLRAHEMLGALS